MTNPRSWEIGSHEARWDGYLLTLGSTVLRNKIGATTPDDLRAAENDLLEFRLTELRSHPGLVPRTYDLTHLRRLHFQLFQDVYEWAGDLRTVGIANGEGDDTSFVPPREIQRPVAHVAARIAERWPRRRSHLPHLEEPPPRGVPSSANGWGRDRTARRHLGGTRRPAGVLTAAQRDVRETHPYRCLRNSTVSRTDQPAPSPSRANT